MFLEWPVLSFVCGMLFDPLARPFVCLERLFLVGSAQRGASMEGKVVMPSRSMAAASGGKRHDMKEVNNEIGFQ